MDDFMPTPQDFDMGRVTNAQQSEVIKKRYYDWNLYATAGTTQMNFFSQSIGQGITTAIGGVVGSPKTDADTSMVTANTLPSGIEFLVDSLEVQFFPGSVNTANTYTPADISRFGAASAAALAGALNDINTIMQSGVLEFNVLNKNYITDTPLMAFPPKTRFLVDSSQASTSATQGASVIASGKVDGRPWYVQPRITLQPAVNFNVRIRWPAAVATPSGFNARIGVILDGFEMRASQ